MLVARAHLTEQTHPNRATPRVTHVIPDPLVDTAGTKRMTTVPHALDNLCLDTMGAYSM